MFKTDKNNNMTLTRGDTAYANVVLYSDEKHTTQYTLQDGDSLVFTLRKTPKINSEDKDYIFQKEFVDNEVKILPSDTGNLEYGDYIYDVQLTYANGDVDTIITERKLTLTYEMS